MNPFLALLDDPEVFFVVRRKEQIAILARYLEEHASDRPVEAVNLRRVQDAYAVQYRSK